MKTAKKIDKDIKAAMLKNRGGFEQASDAQIMKVWGMLDAETKTQYLDSVKEKKVKKPNADIDG